MVTSLIAATSIILAALLGVYAWVSALLAVIGGKLSLQRVLRLKPGPVELRFFALILTAVSMLYLALFITGEL